MQTRALAVSLAPAALEAPGRSLPAAVQHGATGRFLALQRPGRRFVPSELRAALAVTVRGAGLAVQRPLLAPGTRGQTLGDVLVVCGGPALVRAAVEVKVLTLGKSNKAQTLVHFKRFFDAIRS